MAITQRQQQLQDEENAAGEAMEPEAHVQHEEVPPAEAVAEHGHGDEDPEVAMQERERRLSAIAGRQAARGVGERVKAIHILFAIHLRFFLFCCSACAIFYIGAAKGRTINSRLITRTTATVHTGIPADVLSLRVLALRRSTGTFAED